MKFSLIAAASVALAATSDATSDGTWVNLYTKEYRGGSCKGFPVDNYNACYDVSAFSSVQSASFINKDLYNDKITISFFTDKGCVGDWTRDSGYWPTTAWHQWGYLENVHGTVKSVMVYNTIKTPGNGDSDEYKSPVKARLTTCKSEASTTIYPYK